jgi:phosphoglycolate phosphatase
VKLLITDLDNTLYDWVTYFATSFRAMVGLLAEDLGVPVDHLLDEFKAVHQKHHDSEHPFALFEIETVRSRYGSLSTTQLVERFDRALHEFNRSRRQHLRLYPDVRETLERLRERGVQVVGYTEANAVNAYFRLQILEIDQFFSRLYATEGWLGPHPLPGRQRALPPPDGLIRGLPAKERKPNPTVLMDICSGEGFAREEAVYVGDSLTRDVSMATAAGVMAVWAAYGLDYDKSLWDLLVRVTHWTPADVEREARLRRELGEARPDLTIRSFGELLSLNWG